VADTGSNPRIEFVNRVLGSPDSWPTPRAMLVDMCVAFGLRSAGIRWPAEGAAVLLAETAPGSTTAFSISISVPEQVSGQLWTEGTAKDSEWLKLVANALGSSRVLRKFLGPAADQARIARRLDDAAKVAGRVAHDLDNVFQGVTGFASLALDSLHSNSPAYSNIQEVETSARHGLKFCAQLHQLNRGGTARPLPAAVSGAITRELGRITPVFPAVRFESDVFPNLPPVAFEGGGLQVVLGLLLDNAAEASPKDGTVRIKARLVELASADLAGFLGSPATGPHVEVRISDQGPGLTEEARQKMFVEPFFTTKFRHRGLSLAVVYRMIFAHHGGVQADSLPGKGTTIRVVLPLSAARVPAVETVRSTGGFSR